ncbi:hypothetical protein BJY14_004698 [Actinomadura luteofluorescens]|uniref:Uncharacterized protein n=1 Tax=Actinomadura luteofluorescens TaxID=46163 RepID=A0A7Y9JH69_9ACTN|nr:hypothetical protein [Actinomadura luteofluorescens]
MRAPPASAPAIPPTPPAADQAPNARARSRPPVKPVLITASVAGASSAAPAPWTARAATRTCGAAARPPARLEAENRNIPAASARRWPARSAARPPSSISPAKVSR